MAKVTLQPSLFRAVIDPTKPTISNNDRQFWNGFVDYVAQRGYAGSPRLDERSTKLSRLLFDEYNRTNKGNYAYDTFIPAIQTDISNYRNNAINEIKKGNIKVTNDDGSLYRGNINDYDFDNNYMQGLSNVDGWAGSRTTSWKFPKAYLEKGGKVSEVENKLYNR